MSAEYTFKSNILEGRMISGAFDDVVATNSDGYTVVDSSLGVYTITFSEEFAAMTSFSACVEGAAEQYVNVTTAFVPSTGVLVITLTDAAAANAALGSGERVLFTAIFKK